MDTKDSTSDLIHAFRSERLQYRKADETDADYKAIIAKVEQDPVTQALASPAILQPRRQKELDQYAENLARSLLGVTICLLPEEATRFRAQSGVEVDEDGVNSQIVIGVMALGGGGILHLLRIIEQLHLASELLVRIRIEVTEGRRSTGCWIGRFDMPHFTP
ncbi:hypothetical protein ACCO45_006811 [Purpureocillium lilacinum]|uniref:Uncharacterized protein n=1 Tax=Purpureocillium lilacinum TaxID=33203 RepID=A0ACC4DSY2_PURLI